VFLGVKKGHWEQDLHNRRMDLFTEISSEKKAQKPVSKALKQWMPRQVLFTPESLEEAYGVELYDRIRSLNLPVEVLKNNRLTGLRGATERETYKLAKTTMAVVKAPPSAFKLTPIPPSADWQFHLAQGCPAHCQYCYLAGSLSGPPVIRVFSNLPSILENLQSYQGYTLTTF
jgi:spore photoproduct lyase